MKYRAFCYLLVGGNTVRMTSQALDTEEAANAVLDKMTTLEAMSGEYPVSGGDLETYVDGIGWVLGGTTEAESAVLICNRQEHVDACVEFEEIVGHRRSDDPRP